MLIDGGSNKGDQVISEDNIAVTASQAVAYASKSCVAVLRQVPNQRLYFYVRLNGIYDFLTILERRTIR